MYMKALELPLQRGYSMMKETSFFLMYSLFLDKFQLASALLMFLGIKMFTLVGSVEGAVTARFVSIPALLLIFLSLICLVIGIIGCAGASFENRKVQGVVSFTTSFITWRVRNEWWDTLTLYHYSCFWLPWLLTKVDKIVSSSKLNSKL